MKKVFPLFAFFAVLLTPCLDAKSVVIYHTSDAHGRYMPTAVPQNTEGISWLGGYPAISNLVKKEHRPVLLLDSGDWFQGSPEGNLSKGMASIAMMNKMGYTASAPGNHDFDFGAQNLKNLCSQAKFPILAANRADKTPGFSCIKPYRIVEAEGYKIAIVGFLPPGPARATLPENIAPLSFADAAQAMVRTMPALEKEKVDAIVVLSHQGICINCPSYQIGPAWQPATQDVSNGNISIARAVPGKIALIMGGHTHTTLKNGYYDRVSSTTFAESGSNLTSVSRVVLDFDDTTRKVKQVSVKAVYPWLNDTGEDPEIKAILAGYTQQFALGMDNVLGRADKPIARFASGRMDSPMGNWFTDMMAKAANTPIALQNSSGIRDGIPRGPVTGRVLFNVMPFDNSLVTMKLTGKQLYAVLKRAMRPDGTCALQVSGLTVQVMPGGLKIKIAGKPLADGRLYQIATNNFTASGPIFSEGIDKTDTKIMLRDALVRAVKANPNIVAPKDIRITK
ncbi:MAG: bifunctional UDP-sugar hydrolase/5'-nucleotidase [Elusimicrobiaceae bacterium]